MITLPPGSRQRPPGEEQQPLEERDRVIAFRENGLLKPLGGRDDLAAQQEAGQHVSSVGIGPYGYFSYTDFVELLFGADNPFAPLN